MNPSAPSQTALNVAMRRAAHQLLDHPLVLNDPIAIPILGAETAAALRRDPHSFENIRIAPILRAFMVVRSRYAEDTLAQYVARGIRQYVILGAGLDTFAYRNPFPVSQLRVFEVDHPSTQAWKRERLQHANIPLPPNLTFAPVNFEAQPLATGLVQAGFDPNQPAFFSWLGVTMYLSADTVMGTLRYIASLPGGSGVVFDYGKPRESYDLVGKIAHDRLASRVAALGEPWLSAFHAEQLVPALRALGFHSVNDITPNQLQTLYLQNRTDELRIGTLVHIINAQV